MNRRVRSLVCFAVALWSLATTTVLFRVRGRRAVAAAAAAALRMVPNDAEDALRASDEIWIAFRAVRRAKRLWPTPVKCLQTALVMQRVLVTRGIQSRLVIGASGTGGGLQAHAWLRVGDFVLDDQRVSSQFEVLELAGSAPASSELGAPIS